MQMLTSKDANFIGYTFKKSDILKSAETSGAPLSEHRCLELNSSIFSCDILVRTYQVPYETTLFVKGNKVTT